MHQPYNKNITIQAFEQKIPPWTEKVTYILNVVLYIEEMLEE